MAKNNTIILGLDNGNGTVISSARSAGEVRETLWPAIYGFGKNETHHMNNKEVATFIDPATNGYALDFKIDRGGVEYGLGQTAFEYSHNIKGLGEDRYEDKDFMLNMLYGSIQSLINRGLYCDRVNDVYTCVGMPPKWFYQEPDKHKVFLDAYNDMLLDKTYTIKVDDNENNDKVFNFKEHLIISETLSGYFDWLRDDNLKAIEDRPSDKGALLIDVGQGTLDMAILRDLELGQEKINTSMSFGTHTLFEILIDLMVGVRDVTVSDVEAFYYNKKTRIGNLGPEYKSKMPTAKQLYFNLVRNELRQNYAKKLNRFDYTLVMGGILEICTPKEIESNFNIGGGVATPLDVMSNARGYRKTIEGWALKNRKIQKWGK